MGKTEAIIQNMGNELRRIRNEMGKSQQKMAELLGIPQTTWSRYETGTSRPPMGLLFDLAERGYVIEGLTAPTKALPPLDSVDLAEQTRILRRLGLHPEMDLEKAGQIVRMVMAAEADLPPLDPEPRSPQTQDPIPVREFSMVQFRRGVPMEVSTDENDPNGVVLLPLFNQRSAAGPGQEVLDRVEVETLVPVVREILGHRSPKDCGVVRVVGDSMAEIQLNNGDRAIFDRSDIEGDGVFVITHNGAVRIKRLQYRFDVKRVFIKSENRRYPDVEEEPLEAIGSTLRIEGKVIGWLHRHLY